MRLCKLSNPKKIYIHNRANDLQSILLISQCVMSAIFFFQSLPLLPYASCVFPVHPLILFLFFFCYSSSSLPYYYFSSNSFPTFFAILLPIIHHLTITIPFIFLLFFYTSSFLSHLTVILAQT
jgi:hypothetical protein